MAELTTSRVTTVLNGLQSTPERRCLLSPKEEREEVGARRGRAKVVSLVRDDVVWVLCVRTVVRWFGKKKRKRMTRSMLKKKETSKAMSMEKSTQSAQRPRLPLPKDKHRFPQLLNLLPQQLTDMAVDVGTYPRPLRRRPYNQVLFIQRSMYVYKLSSR